MQGQSVLIILCVSPMSPTPLTFLGSYLGCRTRRSGLGTSLPSLRVIYCTISVSPDDQALFRIPPSA